MQNKSKFSYFFKMVIYLFLVLLCALFLGTLFSLESGITICVIIVTSILTFFTFLLMLAFIPMNSNAS